MKEPYKTNRPNKTNCGVACKGSPFNPKLLGMLRRDRLSHFAWHATRRHAALSLSLCS